jgi:protein disulfide-isomerase
MRRNLLPVSGVIASLLMALTATAQESSIHWQQDIEAAKVQARQSGRLVLVHVVADGCGPCRSLESNVFSQPGVAGAIEARFVPVKLNANEFPAIAQGFGITRVPTDVVITPEGQVVGKQISPSTPTAYVADLTTYANQYASQSGQAYRLAAAAAPSPPSLNTAYSDLEIGVPIPPMAAAQAASAPVATAGAAPPANSYNLFTPPTTTTPPAVVSNNYVAPAAPSYTSPGAATAAVPTNPAANPYTAYAPPSSVQSPVASQPPTASMPRYGYDPEQTTPISSAPAQSSPPSYGVPADRSVPPAASSQPTSEEAQLPSVTQQVAAPDPSKLPPGVPPLGFDGYCPVSMRHSWKWTPGDPKYGAIHRGRTYWFAGPQEQQEFLAHPDTYGPALAGVDPVLAIDHQQSVLGMRDHSLDYDGQFYLFSSEATLQQFTSNPERYASGVRQAMGLPPSQQTR